MKLYGYFVGGILMKISPNLETLQEIYMDDYFEEAYYQYNVLTQTNGTKRYYYPTPIEFWKTNKNYMSYRNITDMDAYYVE